MNDVLKRLGQLRVIPMIAIDRADDAAPLADAFLAGGLACMEITFRTDAAEEAMKIVARRGDILLGAGTVLTVEQADRAIDAGATFIVSPGLNPKVVERCLEKNVTVTPGVVTPTDIEQALGLGLSVVKFFPAEAYGGLKTIKALSGPYGQVRFIPTGGIGPENLAEYLAFPKILACGGSWLAKKDTIHEGRFDEITALARRAVEIADTAGK